MRHRVKEEELTSMTLQKAPDLEAESAAQELAELEGFRGNVATITISTVGHPGAFALRKEFSRLSRLVGEVNEHDVADNTDYAG
jgi:hypothetical protein